MVAALELPCAVCRTPAASPLARAGLFDARPDVDNCFNFYLDYLLECIVDPDFPETVRRDPRARQYYNYAIHKIEIDELARWRYCPANRLLTQKLECIATRCGAQCRQL